MVLDTIATPGQLAGVTRFVRENCGAPPGSETNRLDLVVEELFLNIALHGSPGGPVRIICAPDGPGIVALEFSHGGPPFNPATDAPEPDLDAPLADRRIGGLGLFLVREMAEAVDYRREDGMNRLTVKVKLE